MLQFCVEAFVDYEKMTSLQACSCCVRNLHLLVSVPKRLYLVSYLFRQVYTD